MLPTGVLAVPPGEAVTSAGGQGGGAGCGRTLLFGDAIWRWRQSKASPVTDKGRLPGLGAIAYLRARYADTARRK